MQLSVIAPLTLEQVGEFFSIMIITIMPTSKSFRIWTCKGDCSTRGEGRRLMGAGVGPGEGEFKKQQA
eukprot:746474-Hanusia_phi.AAC.7